jgi:arylsulfatase A-like enzyme
MKFCALLSAFVIFFFGNCFSAERPNILFIYTDDHSHRTVSCYPEAYDWVNTPNIDKLAKNGTRFRYAYIGTWCMPSRATLLTGHYQHGIESMRMVGDYPGSDYDPERCPFWPKVFRENGLSNGSDRKMAYRHRHRGESGLGSSSSLEPSPLHQKCLGATTKTS